jgi:hypothetical protein
VARRIPPKLIIKGRTINGFPAFVIEQYAHTTGKKDTAAIEYIAERWALRDSEAESYGATLKAYQTAYLTEVPEEGRAQILRISDTKRKKKPGQEGTGEADKQSGKASNGTAGNALDCRGGRDD